MPTPRWLPAFLGAMSLCHISRTEAEVKVPVVCCFQLPASLGAEFITL